MHFCVLLSLLLLLSFLDGYFYALFQVESSNLSEIRGQCERLICPICKGLTLMG